MGFFVKWARRKNNNKLILKLIWYKFFIGFKLDKRLIFWHD